MNKRTIVLGASTKPQRFSNKAVKLLQTNNVPVFAVGLREGEINGTKIHTEFPTEGDFHTLTLYINPKRQAPYMPKVEALSLKRVIFNPGTQNPEWAEKLEANGVEVVENCTLVMLNNDMY
jgi:predicted CoA-binding protein